MIKTIRLATLLLCMALGCNAGYAQSKASKDLTIKVNGVSFVMKRVEGGTFQMGATSEQGSDAYSSESPVHSVTLSSFYMGETEVTQELWKAVMGSNPSYFAPKESSVAQCSYDAFVADAKRLNAKKQGSVRIPSRQEWDATMKTTEGSLKNPVEMVSWDDCQEFISKLNQLTGRNFRLPTEAEWEYAARGGKKSQGYKYAGSNTIDDVAWYTKTSNDSGTKQVKTKSPNELGLYDMSGNVWEWCQDLYGEYGSASQANPQGPSSGSLRVLRGGDWFDDSGGCRVSNRDDGHPGYRDSTLGFRLCLPQ